VSQPRIPPPPSPPPSTSGSTDPLWIAWKESMVNGIKHSDEMFTNVLKKFTVPFWLSVIMNVAVFVIGMIGFTVAMIYGLIIGNSVFGIVFGGLDITTVLSFFLSNPIERLERDVGFITWIGLVYNSYWIGLTYATNAATFQSDLKAITGDATKSIGDLLDKQQKLKSDSKTNDSATSTTPSSGKTSPQNAGQVVSTSPIP
jgi:hypothetical protein